MWDPRAGCWSEDDVCGDTDQARSAPATVSPESRRCRKQRGVFSRSSSLTICCRRLSPKVKVAITTRTSGIGKKIPPAGNRTSKIRTSLVQG